MTQEALSSLQTLGAQLRAKLLELPEYRALTVIERTIEELSEIINLTAAPVARPEPQAAPAEASAGFVAAPQRVEPPPPPIAGPSQGRMARAIAEAIAAKTAAFNATGASASYPGPTFNAAS
jgi:hypothetical protein